MKVRQQVVTCIVGMGIVVAFLAGLHESPTLLVVGVALLGLGGGFGAAWRVPTFRYPRGLRPEDKAWVDRHVDLATPRDLDEH